MRWFWTGVKTMLPLFRAFREALWTSQEEQISSFSKESIELMISYFMKSLTNAFVVSGISLLMLFAAIIWMITACCRKFSRTPKQAKGRRILNWMIGTFSALWLLMLYASCHQVGSFARTQNGINEFFVSLKFIPDTFNNYLPSMQKKVDDFNVQMIPFFVAPVASYMCNSMISLKMQQVFLEINTDPMKDADSASISAEFIALYKASKLVTSVLYDGGVKKDFSQEEKDLLSSVFDEEYQIFFYYVDYKVKISDSIFDRIEHAEDVAATITKPFLAYSIISFIFLLCTLVLFCYFMWTKSFARFRIIWWLLISISIFFYVIHALLLPANVLFGATCDGFYRCPISENRRIILGSHEIPLKDLSMSINSCASGRSWPEVYLEHFKDRTSSIAHGALFVRDRKTTLISLKLNDFKCTLSSDGDNRYGECAAQLARMYGSNSFKYIDRLVQRINAAKARKPHSLYDSMLKACNYRLHMHNSAATEAIRDEKASTYAGPLFQKIFNCQDQGILLEKLSDFVCKDVINGLDGFVGSHHMLAWIGFILLIHLYVISLQLSSMFTSVKQTEMELGSHPSAIQPMMQAFSAPLQGASNHASPLANSELHPPLSNPLSNVDSEDAVPCPDYDFSDDSKPIAISSKQ